MTDPVKRSKALRTIHSLQALVDHPKTGDGERQAAKGRIKVLKDKWGIVDAPKPPPRQAPRPPQDRTGGFNSTSRDFTQEEWSRFTRNFEGNAYPGESDAERVARKIRRQQDAYDAWKRMNDEQLRRDRAQSAATSKAREESRLRAEAQERYKDRHANSDANGQQRRPGEDVFDFANRVDGRTQAEKNRDMQNRNRNLRDRGHTTNPYKRCERPATFYDAGGEPRKRNEFPMTCDACGSHLQRGEGHVQKAGSTLIAECCEMVPGPKAKKPGRG